MSQTPTRSAPGSAGKSRSRSLLPQRTARFAAFFSDEQTARAALVSCQTTASIEAAQCRLLCAGRPGAAARLNQLPRSATPRGDRAAVLRAVLLGGLAGGVLAGLLSGFTLGVVGALFTEGVGPLRATEMAVLFWSALGAVAGALAGAWLSLTADAALSARRFEATVRKRLNQGDSAVVLSGLQRTQLAPLVNLLESRCQRWCHDAGSRLRL